MKILLVGFGSLGLRHLQSIAQLGYFVDVLDPSVQNIDENSQQIENIFHNKIKYHNEPLSIGSHYDICIISTSSKPRLRVIEDLQQRASWNFLILEKFLFPNINEYKIFEEIYKYNLDQVYVNCPRRYYPDYQNIKNSNPVEDFIGMNVQGSNWGMSTNGIHFLDLYSYLSSDKLNSFEPTSLKTIKSKREGYGELIGNISFFSSNSYLKLSSDETKALESFTIEILFKNKTYIVDELNNSCRIISNQSNNNTEVFTPIFQSNLTHLYINDIIRIGYTNLPKYLQSRYDHLIFLDSLKDIKDLQIT